MPVTAATAEPLAAPCPRSTNGAGSWAEETSAVKTTLGTVRIHQLMTTLGSLHHDDGTWLMTVRYTVQQQQTRSNNPQLPQPQQRHQQQLSELSNGTVCQQPISCSVTILRQIITREGIFTGLAKTGQAKESTNLCRTVGVRRSTSTLHPATVGRG